MAYLFNDDKSKIEIKKKIYTEVVGGDKVIS